MHLKLPYMIIHQIVMYHYKIIFKKNWYKYLLLLKNNMYTITNSTQFREKVAESFNIFFETELNISKNIEIGIYIYTLKECDRRKVVKKWSNYFTY